MARKPKPPRQDKPKKPADWPSWPAKPDYLRLVAEGVELYEKARDSEIAERLREAAEKLPKSEIAERLRKLAPQAPAPPMPQEPTPPRQEARGGGRKPSIAQEQIDRGIGILRNQAPMTVEAARSTLRAAGIKGEDGPLYRLIIKPAYGRMSK